MATVADETPIGVTLCNPLNIDRTRDVWLGQDTTYTGRYIKFSSPEYCYRAAALILRGYEHRGIHTLRGAISTWAPVEENPTQQYLENVCRWTGIDPDTKTALDTLPILRAMTRQEVGDLYATLYPDSLILLGIALANPQPET